MTTNLQIKFTPSEWEIITHRLEVSDAIAECLTDCDDPVASYDEIVEVADELERNGQDSIDWGSALHRSIIWECCEGSTYFAGLHADEEFGETTPQKVSAMHRVADNLEIKLGHIPRK